MAQLTSHHMTPRPNKRAPTKLLEHTPAVIVGGLFRMVETCQHTEAWG